MTDHVCGRLTVLRRSTLPLSREAYWVCVCACGTEKVATGSQLRARTVQSCGCLQRETRSRVHKTHGRSKSAAYKNWANMLSRCRNPKATQYKDYGARGIAVCKRWRSFENFLEDMGEPPAGCSIDRIDSNGGYNKKNCQWSTRMEQAANKRSTRLLTFAGVTQHLVAWARDLGVAHATLRERFDRGWSIERALTTPGRGKVLHLQSLAM